jgi:hypothetical protein
MGSLLSFDGRWIPQGVHPIVWSHGAPGPQRNQALANHGLLARNASAGPVFTPAVSRGPVRPRGAEFLAAFLGAAGVLNFPSGLLQSPPSRGISLAARFRCLVPVSKLRWTHGSMCSAMTPGGGRQCPSAARPWVRCRLSILRRGTRPAYRGQSHKLSQAGSTPAPATDLGSGVESRHANHKRNDARLVECGQPEISALQRCLKVSTVRGVMDLLLSRFSARPSHLFCSAVHGNESTCRAVKAVGGVSASDAGVGLSGRDGSGWRQSINLTAGSAPFLLEMAAVPISRASGPAVFSFGGAL